MYLRWGNIVKPFTTRILISLVMESCLASDCFCTLLAKKTTSCAEKKELCSVEQENGVDKRARRSVWNNNALPDSITQLPEPCCFLASAPCNVSFSSLRLFRGDISTFSRYLIILLGLLLYTGFETLVWYIYTVWYTHESIGLGILKLKMVYSIITFFIITPVCWFTG